MPRPALRTVFAVLAIAFFATPLALRAVGVEADAFENRKLAKAPSVSEGWDFFDQAAAFLTDRMPLREQAVEANTEISQRIFGTTPRYGRREGDRALPFAGARPAGEEGDPEAPKQEVRVIQGREGWLFLNDELIAACSPAVDHPTAVARWRELVRITRASGRRAVMLVPPDKSSIYPEFVPAGNARRACARAGTLGLWGQIESLPVGSGVRGLRRATLRRKRRGGDLLYARADSHWTTVGAAELVREALRAIGGRLRVGPGEIVKVKDSNAVGDLTTLIGAPRRDRKPERSVRRAAGAPKVPGHTLYIRDSYGDIATGLIAPYFADFEPIYWVGSSRRELLRAIARADTVVYETVEREFAQRASARGPVNPRFLELLRKRLPRRSR